MNTNRSKVYSKEKNVAKSERNLLCEVLRLLNRISRHLTFGYACFFVKNLLENVCVAQLDRALGYGPRCREFESSHAR